MISSFCQRRLQLSTVYFTIFTIRVANPDVMVWFWNYENTILCFSIVSMVVESCFKSLTDLESVLTSVETAWIFWSTSTFRLNGIMLSSLYVNKLRTYLLFNSFARRLARRFSRSTKSRYLSLLALLKSSSASSRAKYRLVYG